MTVRRAEVTTVDAKRATAAASDAWRADVTTVGGKRETAAGSDALKNHCKDLTGLGGRD